MSGKWTEGKWKRSGAIIYVHGKGTIAQCPTPRGGGVFECQHNPDLIAAAPELVEEGEQTATTLEEAANVLAGNGFPGLADICLKQVEKQRAALRKAHGEKE